MKIGYQHLPCTAIGDTVMEVIILHGFFRMLGANDTLRLNQNVVARQTELYVKLLNDPRVKTGDCTFLGSADVFFSSSENLQKEYSVEPIVWPNMYARVGEIPDHEKMTGKRHVLSATARSIQNYFPDYKVPDANKNLFQDFSHLTHELPFSHYLVFQTSTSNFDKSPNAHFWCRLAQRLLIEGENIIFLGTHPNMEYDIFCHAHPEQTYNLIGKTTLAEGFGYIQNAKAVFGGDTGLTHFASASDIPTISIFGSKTDATVTGPYHHQGLAIQTTSTPPECPTQQIIDKYKQAFVFAA